MLPSTFIYVTSTYRPIPLYPATDGQQTGNNFIDGNKQHVYGNMLPGNMLPWYKRGLSERE